MTEQKLNIKQYVETMAQLLELPLNSEYREGVIENLERIERIAKLVTEFPLPETIEPAPKFEP